MDRSDAETFHSAARRRAALVAALVAVVTNGMLSACTSTAAADDAHEEKAYRTGSNIPVRDRNAPSDAKIYDPNSIQDAVRGTAPPPPVGLKGG